MLEIMISLQSELSLLMKHIELGLKRKYQNLGSLKKVSQIFDYSEVVCDGIQWDLEFEYNNNHKPVRFNHDNTCPYNFGKFKVLFGIDDREDDDDE